jgi:cytochrome bd-type quinol oxidase subunit 1
MHCNYEIMKRKLLKSLVLGAVFVSPLVVFGQVSQHSGIQQKQTKQSASKNMSFDEYCEQNAVQLMDVPSGKLSDVKIAGTLNYIDSKKQPSLKAYGVKPAENETTYYKLNGSDKLLAVKSLYVLKLNFANAKN